MNTVNTQDKAQNNLKVVAYLRVSTDNHAMEDSFGLPAQKEAILAYASTQGIEVAAFFVDDGHSGATLDRPGLQQLLKEASLAKHISIPAAK